MNSSELFGLEIEFEKTSIKNIINQDKRIEQLFSVTYDASVETPCNFIYGYPATIKSNKVNPRILQNGRLGGELVLRYPLPINAIENKNFETTLKSTLEILHCEEKSIRSSIHFHFDIQQLAKDRDVATLKNIIRVLNRTESLIYRLSGIFKDHRGIYNNYNYCRPITLWGPACYRIGNSRTNFYYGQLFDTRKLVLAKSYKEFFYLYGDSLRNSEWKYHPVRYHGFNLFSLLRHGSLEYRTMNFTSSYINIIAMLLFFYTLTNFMLNIQYSDLTKIGVQPINSIYSPNHSDNIVILSIILDLIPDKYKIYKNRIIDLFELGRYSKIEKGYYMSHMVDKSDSVLFSNFDYELPERIEKDLIKNPTYTDVHNINVTDLQNRNWQPVENLDIEFPNDLNEEEIEEEIDEEEEN